MLPLLTSPFRQSYNDYAPKMAKSEGVDAMKTVNSNSAPSQQITETVFAAAVIGGIALDGGKSTMSGALTGVLLLGVVQNLLTLAQVPSFWIQAVYGGIILVALMIARVTTGRAKD